MNLFCYGQVESPYGSGQFIKDLSEHFDEDEQRRDVSEIKDKDAIMDSHQGLPREGQVACDARLKRAARRTSRDDAERDRGLRARATGSTSSPIIFEMLDYKQMNEVAAYGGFPTRYPHWRFGMEYEQLAKSYEYGLSKIYEMVINNNPSYAYLLEGNSLVDQKLVMAHVFGHVDFFKNNFFFSQDQPQDDRQHGEPRRARAPPHRAPRASRRSRASSTRASRSRT